MRNRILTTLLVFFCPLFFIVFSGAAEDRLPVQAELVRAIEAGRIHIGDSIYAKVTLKWKNPQCTLREGAVLKGRIVAQGVHSKTEKRSEIALLFESGQCDGPDLKPLPLTLAALVAGDPEQDANNYEYQPLSDAVGVSIGGGASSGRGNLRSVTGSAATIQDSPSRYKGPSAVLPGEVVGIKGVKLNVGNGPEGSSVLSTLGHNVRLESGTQLVLVPSLSAPTPPNANVSPVAPPSVARESTNTSVTTSADDETVACSPPQCTEMLVPNEPETKHAAASATLSVRDLGYVPGRADQEMYRFDYASAISYLGPESLLFTFNPHVLVRRSGEEAKFAKLRIIRAVLINVQEKKIEKTVDWKVPDSRQYLWSMGKDRVLVHVGRELRLYGPGLKLEQRLMLNGPLAFLRTSPSSTYFAVGVLLERHSEAIHRELEEAEEREPEEDVEIKVFDASFHILATVVRSSRVAAPLLSENGELRILRVSKNRWEIVEDAWDGQKRIVARASSTCRPEATSLPPNLLFVIGCDRQTTGKWYRVIRPNGKPILQGWSSSAELEHTANGVANGDLFAIGIAEAAKSLAAESAFRASDLESEHIGVYRTENGERMFALTLPSAVPAVQTFGLSPDGGQLAVLQGDQIAFYAMPPVSGSR
ncbi:MAG: hypothetical protein WB919_10425 [Candidatus Sulfotelmatobacter sp.]